MTRKKRSRLSSDRLVCVLDAGTTNMKASLVDAHLQIIDSESRPLSKRAPHKKWVEQDPEEIFSLGVSVLNTLLKRNMAQRSRCIGLGITNQRETTIVWNKKTGRAVYPAIVWQDERTKATCEQLKRKISAHLLKEKTGLVLDPYFSAPKISWILQHVPRAQKLLAQKRLLFGTVDTWLIWKLTGGKHHVTDSTNASRTLLFNIRTRRWDEQLLSLFQVPYDILPTVHKSFSNFGRTKPGLLLFSLPLRGVLGDQQAALYASGSRTGTTKITYGTGAFILQNTGKKFYTNPHLFTTLAAGPRNSTVYAVEGKVSPCGDLVKKVLGDTKKLRLTIRSIARNINHFLTFLPLPVTKIFIDGGVTRDGIMQEEQGKISRVPIVSKHHFELTTLGTAKLIFDNQK